MIASKVLADELCVGVDFSIAKEWNVNGEMVIISVEKV